MSTAIRAASLEPQQLLALVDRALGNDADAVPWACDRLTAWIEAQRIRAVRRQREAMTGRVAVGDEVGVTDTADEGHRLELLSGVALPALPSPSGPVTLRTPREIELLHRRAEVLDGRAGFASALDTATITAAHVDRVADTMRRLQPEVRRRLLDDEARHLAVATTTNANEFARHLRREEARLTRHATGDRLEQQRRQVRPRERIDHDTGMHHLTLLLDPVSAVRLSSRIEGATETLFHRSAPHGCPTDPFERQGFLRAHALLSLLDGKGGSSGRPEIDWGLPVEVPERVLRELHPHADVHAVVVRNGVVLHAPGRLDLGRSTRLASRHQRRALRALYRGCAVPGCEVRFDQCTVHHVMWWRHGGRTDLDNLLRLCHRHHTHVHRDGWTLQLGPQRQVTLTLPDGTVRATGPPRRSAA